jgi:large subunit ribosomal protein L25
MKTAQLSGSARTNVGKKDAKALRNAELVPCVLYGTGEQTHFSVKKNDIEKIVFSPEVYQVALDIDGKKANAIVRELQQHPVKDTIHHVDFLEVTDAKPIRIGLPIRLTGKSPGVMAGGRLMQVFRKLNVLGLAKDLPDAITLDISKLKIGKSFRIKDITIPGVKVLDPANAVVVSVKMARGAVKPADDDDEEEMEDAPVVASEETSTEEA